jgi:hypothetical protein
MLKNESIAVGNEEVQGANDVIKLNHQRCTERKIMLALLRRKKRRKKFKDKLRAIKMKIAKKMILDEEEEFILFMGNRRKKRIKRMNKDDFAAGQERKPPDKKPPDRLSNNTIKKVASCMYSLIISQNKQRKSMKNMLNEEFCSNSDELIGLIKMNKLTVVLTEI